MSIQYLAPPWRQIVILFAFNFASCFFIAAQPQAPVSPDSLLHHLDKNPLHDTTRVLLLNQLAFNNYYNNPVSSLRYGFEAKKISDSLHFTKGQADAFRQIGLSFWAQGDMSTAINYFLSGLRIAEVNYHAQEEADITGNIGTAYNGMGNPQEALNFLNLARSMQQKLNNLWREASVLNNIGDSYLALKQFDKAIESYSLALKFSSEKKYKLGITTNIRNLGNVLEIKEKYDSALANYFQCIELSFQINDNRGYILSHKSIASVYLKTRKLNLAKQHANIALDAAKKAMLRAFIRDAYELLSKISEAEGDRNEAYDYFKLYTAYRDSVQNLRVVTEVASQRIRFETEKNQSEIALLKKDSEFQTERLSSKNAQLILSIVISVLTLLLLAIAARNFLRMKKVNILLGEKNKEIQLKQIKLFEQNDELAALNEEIRSQQEEVIAQRDALIGKNQEIENVYQKIVEVNENLEHLVTTRTKVLEEQNKKLSEYAFQNAHELRAPLARIMGLVNLLLMDSVSNQQPVILAHLKQSSDELDGVVRSITKTIQKGLDTFPAIDEATGEE